MKKIINGRLYNTSTAKRLAICENGLNTNDSGYCGEDLYLTKSGAYFLHGEGGGSSRYGEWHGNTGGWGEQIVPLTLAEAMEWAENRLSGEEYSNIFGEPEEAGDGREALMLSVSAATKAKLRRMAEEQGKSMSAVMDELVAK
jgi:hypothetical protein